MEPLPSLFIGHGSPMNAIETNQWTDAWAKIGLTLPRPKAILSVPTPEHYLPLLHVVAARQSGDAVSFPVEGIDGRSVSMRAVRVG